MKHRLLCIAITLLLASTVASADCRSRKAFPKFDRYPAGERYRGKIHPLVLNNHLARMFRTMIRETMAEGVNFDGHYVVAVWGCGSGCEQLAVVDAITGILYAPPFDDMQVHNPLGGSKWLDFDPEDKWWCMDNRYMATFKANSALLVVEGCVTEKQCGRSFFRMTTTGLKQIYFDPDRYPDGTAAPF